MSTEVEVRALVDDRFRAELSRLKSQGKLEPLVNDLIKKGHNISHDTIRKLDRPKYYNTIKASDVPYDFYVAIVGKEPENIRRLQSSHLVKQIAPWLCYFFDVGRKEFARQIAKDAKQQGLDYTMMAIWDILFTDGKRPKINPVITDIVANRFREANGKNYSLDTIEKLVNELDDIPFSGKTPDTVSWDTARPVIDELIGLTGKSFMSLVPGYGGRTRLESGRRELKVKDYSKLLRELQELPEYRELLPYRVRLVQGLNHIKDTLQSAGLSSTRVEYFPTISGLNEKELQLLNQGIQNYGEKAFMEHIFPQYIAIKQEHASPTSCFEMLVGYPKKMNGNCEVPLDVIAASIGNKLQYYKENILDRNKSLGHDIGVTVDGINMVHTNAMKKVNGNNGR